MNVSRSVSPSLNGRQFHDASGKLITSPQRTLGSLFVDESLRAELIRRSVCLHDIPRLDDPRVKVLPAKVHRYHSLMRLDSLTARPRNPPTLGFQTFVYRCIGTLDGNVYALRQVENLKSVSDRGKMMAEMWQRIHHANIVRIRDVFISSEIGEVPSLFAAYDFCPGFDTLENYLQSEAAAGAILNEQAIWSAIIQLLSAISAATSQSLSLTQTMVLSKVLISPSSMRIKVNCAGLFDIVNGTTAQPSPKEELCAMGRIAMAIALQNPAAAVGEAGPFLAQIGQRFSTELHGFISLLLSGGPVHPNPIKEMASLISQRLLDEAASTRQYSDSLEDELRKEIQNGRVARLLTKISLLGARLDASADAEWAESGERYVLALFRDHLFRLDDPQENPSNADMGRIIDCLNKLDVGSSERLVLVSRDEQTALVVSYAEVKRALEICFLQSPDRKSVV